MIAQAAGGTFSVTGEADRPPVKPGPSFGDTGTGMLMAISILGALYKRQKTGQGRRLQVAMQDAMIHYMRVPFSRTQLTGKAPPRGGSAHSQPGGLVPSALYPCKPGGPNDYVYIFCSRANPEHWRRLMKVIGREDLIGDARYDTQDARSQHAAEVDEIIAAWTRGQSKEDAMKLIGAAGVPAGAVFDTVELMNEPSLVERGIMQTIEHPTTGKVKMPAWPVRFDGQPAKVKPSPLLGQHNAEVLGQWLGMARAGGRCAEGGRHYRRLSAEAEASPRTPSPRQAARGRGQSASAQSLQPRNCDMTGQDTPAANAAMQRYWNEVAGPRWVGRQAAQEARNVEMLEQLLAAAAAAAGRARARYRRRHRGHDYSLCPGGRSLGPCHRRRYRAADARRGAAAGGRGRAEQCRADPGRRAGASSSRRIPTIC